jgi:hypothetical protein
MIKYDSTQKYRQGNVGAGDHGDCEWRRFARNPDLRRTAGATAARISAVHRIASARVFDGIIRRCNGMPS